jgi:hypothetical protein
MAERSLFSTKTHKSPPDRLSDPCEPRSFHVTAILTTD